jgi:glucose/arabinose dehydrogenase
MYQWSRVADGFQKPVAIAHVGDSRLFIVEQRGVIRVLQDGIVQQEPFLDIRDRVNNSAFEQGLLGLAFDPDFARTGYFYVNYTNAGGDSLISRFTATLGEAQTDPATEATVLRIDQPFSNHNGGDLHFGPDGFLYIAAGDGGSANDPHGNGQNTDTLLGKLLRIKVGEAEPYAIPGDNPFAAGGGRPEIWAYGLRNPWRFSFDSLTGDLYIGDVGQNAWEEIDFLPAGSPGGANFGWNHREGTHPFADQRTEGLIDPIAEYANAGSECSVSGGVVVRDPELPAWQGAYLYGDYCSGGVWGLLRDASGQWQPSRLFSTRFNISAFGTGADGAVYLVSHDGSIYRLESSS